MWEVFASSQVAARRIWPSLIAPLESDPNFRISVTNSHEALQQAVDDAVDSGVSRFVAAGGDGSIHLVVNAVLRHTWSTAPAIATIPLGTGSDFARHFKIPLVPAEAIELARGDAPTFQLADVGTAEGDWGTQHFVNVASIGLTAEVVRTAALMRGLGTARYYLALAMTLPFYRRRRTEIQSEDVDRDEKCIACVIANCQYFGGGVRVLPRAASNDGKLDILTASANSVQFVPLLRRLFAEQHMGAHRTWDHQTSSISFRCEPASAVEMDGEYIGNTPVRFGVIPNAIRVLCPASDSR